ncbi:MAG TPA: SMP-30/gluconolactonase/LRE family protein [Flavisolibacter sp.]|nr:SMP-30/gluconolactonase/LRE family protein [Flavisolibacter sp.]
MHPSLKVYNNSVFDFINKDFEIKTLAGDCLFTEGPVWNEEGFYLFSDIPANCIYKISEEGKKEVFLSNSGTNHPDDLDLEQARKQIGSNALAYDHDGNLLICQHGSHGIAKFDGKNLLPFISTYQNKPFNSPNDLILHNDGRLYFSDPPYGLKDGKLNVEKFQPLAGVYCYDNGNLQLICDKYHYPNGVCLSNDQRTLYICSSKPFEKFISVYDSSNNQFVKVFAEENSDGIEVDRYDNVYLCSKEGIIILNQKGERLALIELSTVPANICWGGAKMNDLFITARENIFLIKGLIPLSP